MRRSPGRGWGGGGRERGVSDRQTKWRPQLVVKGREENRLPGESVTVGCDVAVSGAENEVGEMAYRTSG